VIHVRGARIKPGMFCAFQPLTQPQTELRQAHDYPIVSRSCRLWSMNQDRQENGRGRMHHPPQLILRPSDGNGREVGMMGVTRFCSVRGSVV